MITHSIKVILLNRTVILSHRCHVVCQVEIPIGQKCNNLQYFEMHNFVDKKDKVSGRSKILWDI